MENLKSVRKHIWDVSSGYYCSVCGTCLNLNEQRMILKKIQMECKDLTDHEIHAIMVQSLHYENKLSRRLESHLNAKFRHEISQCEDYDESRFSEIWRERLKAGDICGLFWTAITQKGLSQKVVEEIYSDVHMLSHIHGNKTQKERAENTRLLRINTELTAKFQQEKKKRKELMSELASSEKTRRALEVKVRNLEKAAPPDLQDLENVNIAGGIVQENRELNAKLRQLEKDLDTSLELMRGLEKEKARVEYMLESQKEINLQLSREIGSFIRGQQCDQAECCGEECYCDLCEKRVLIVGGITKLRSFYRNVVENLGGRFEYHDGYPQSGEKELECMIKKSDIVLCPVDCNSHGAAFSVKKICNRINKPYQMLTSSSLSSISSALTAGRLY